MTSRKERMLKEKYLRKKRTEFLKSVLIVVLSVSFISLTYSVIKSQSHSSGSKFSSVYDQASVSGGADAINLYFNYASPEYILFNTEAGRDVFYTDSEPYAKAQKILEDVNRSIFLPDVKAEESAYNPFSDIGENNLLYISYPYHRYPKLTAQFFESRSSKLSEIISSYKKVILSPSEKSTDGIDVYIKDEKTEKIYKIKSSVASAGLQKLLGGTKRLDDRNHSFAYELNLGKSSSTVLRSDIIIPLKTQYLPLISAAPPSAFEKIRDGFTDDGISGKILEAFGLKESHIRQYIDRDNILVCVSETATLKLYPDGIVEYNAVDKKSGLNLSGNTRLSPENSYFLSFTGISKIINSVIPLSQNNEKSFRIRLTDLMSEAAEVTEYKFMFDYYLNGARIISAPYHAIEATTVDGYLTAMRMDLKTLESHNEKAASEPLFAAIDRYCADKQSLSTILISECNRSYDISKNKSSVTAGWIVK